MPAGDIWEERAEPPGTYMSPGCTFSSASPGESVSCFSPSPFPNATSEALPEGASPAERYRRRGSFFPDLPIAPAVPGVGRGPGESGGMRGPSAPRPRVSPPRSPHHRRGSGRGSGAPVPGDGCRQPMGATHGNTGRRRRRRRGWTTGQENEEERGEIAGWRIKGGEGGARRWAEG